MKYCLFTFLLITSGLKLNAQNPLIHLGMGLDKSFLHPYNREKSIVLSTGFGAELNANLNIASRFRIGTGISLINKRSVFTGVYNYHGTTFEIDHSIKHKLQMYEVGIPVSIGFQAVTSYQFRYVIDFGAGKTSRSEYKATLIDLDQGSVVYKGPAYSVNGSEITKEERNRIFVFLSILIESQKNFQNSRNINWYGKLQFRRHGTTNYSAEDPIGFNDLQIFPSSIFISAGIYI